ncbi:MAG: glycoside hydrolase family 127 protein, partial [Clostridia bacterium]|nr:glycoside hydrolase family 127 protein [Clostridia bacterium]
MKETKHVKKYIFATVAARLCAASLAAAMLLPLCMGTAGTVFAAGSYAPEHLEACYSFDDAGAPGADSSGKKRNAKLNGAASSEEGRGGGVLRLDSGTHGVSDAYVTIPADAVRHEKLTITAWVKFDEGNVGSYARVFAVEGSGGNSFHLMANSGTEITGYKAEIYQNGSMIGSVNSDGLIPHSVRSGWNHVALTTDGRNMKLYVNAALIGSARAVFNIEKWNVSGAYLGKTGIWQNPSYNGFMDDVRVYSDALDENEISVIAGFTDDSGMSGVKLLSGLSVGGTQPGEFNPFQDAYYILCPEVNGAAPEVSAEPPFDGASVETVQAEGVPGTAYVHVRYPDGNSRTVSVKFVSPDVSLVHPSTDDVTIDDPFWNDKLKMFAEVTAPYVLRKWVSNTLDNLKNFDKVAAGHRNTKDYVGSMTWGESDWYATMAGTCRLLKQYPDDTLKDLILSYVDHIFAASESVENGYFSIYDLLMTNGKVFSEVDNPAISMSLFNLGYLLEFGIALYEATGDARILRVAVRFLNFTVSYSNHGKRNFVSFHTGAEYNIIAFASWLDEHPEVRTNGYLSDLTMDTADYMELAGHLLSYRGVFSSPARTGGKTFGSYGNDHIPFTALTTGTGHTVEANLYYYALSEYGRKTGDSDSVAAAYRLWENITDRQLYITGGSGCNHAYEAYGGDYNMPNESYTET